MYFHILPLLFVSQLFENSNSERRGPGEKTTPSIKQILLPLLIAFAQQPHQVPAGVQAERARLAGQFEPGLFRRAAAFPVIAAVAASYQVLPRRFAGTRSRDH